MTRTAGLQGHHSNCTGQGYRSAYNEQTPRAPVDSIASALMNVNCKYERPVLGANLSLSLLLQLAAFYFDYGNDHLARLSFIRRARYFGFTLEAVRELLTLSDNNDQSCEAVDHIATAHLAEVERKIADLSALQS